MKGRNRILIVILLFLFLFSVSISLLSTWGIKRTYYRNVGNTFYLLSFIIESYLTTEKACEQQLIADLRQLDEDIRSGRARPDSSRLTNTIKGIWLFAKKDTVSITAEPEKEKDIIRYYRENLKGRDSHARIVLDEEPYYLAHFQHSDLPILVLAKPLNISNIRISTILDSLVSSSPLVYFSILDSAGTPIIYSSLYENFLPLAGPGRTIIKTPVGSIYHIEEHRGSVSIIAGFTMHTLHKTTAINILFLIAMTIVFIGFESALLYTISRFERFRLRKEQEIKHFKEVGALASGFTHEFRNSLNALSLLAKDIPEQEHKHILKQEIARMRTIMDSLKLTAHLSPTKGPLLLEDILIESISLLQHDINAHSTTVQKELEHGLECTGNREMLMVLFSNLLKNSIEAGATLIHIMSKSKGKLCEITVHDNGAGINEGLGERIFEPFFSSKQQTGLGLYLVKKIVELHEGSITARIDEGTTFTINLKREPA